MFDKEPVDIFNSEGTSAPEEDETTEEEDETTEDDEDTDDEETEDGEEDEDEESDEEGDDDEEEEDPKDAEIKRLTGLLKTKNQALRNMRRSKRESGVSSEKFEAPYPDTELVLAKDLPKEEQDEMTDREKKQHDETVKMKQRFNDDAKKQWDKDQKAKADELNPDALDEEEVDDFVKASAQYLAKGDKKLANQIIRKFNQFNNEGLTEEEIEDRLADAAKLVKGFKKVKEQPSGKRGKAVKKKGNKNSLDTIVDSIDNGGTKKPIDL